MIYLLIYLGIGLIWAIIAQIIEWRATPLYRTKPFKYHWKTYLLGYFLNLWLWPIAITIAIIYK